MEGIEAAQKRRRWVHIARGGKPIGGHGVTTCAICRGELWHPCVKCQASNDFDPSFSGLREPTKMLWYTILLMTLRSPFNRLPIDVIHLIYAFALPDRSRTWDCEVITIHCGHIYHRHCAEMWIARRPCCPLDNTPLDHDQLRDFSATVEFSPESMALLNAYKTQNPFTPGFLVRERFHRAQGLISRWIKHNHPWLSSKTAMESMYQANTPAHEQLPPAELTRVFEDLCQKEFISIKRQDDNDTIYEYNP